MKNLRIIWCLISFLYCSLPCAAKFPQPYEQSIFVDKIENNEFQQSLNDLVIYLKKITGLDFSVKESSGQIKSGIYLLFNQPGLLPAEMNKKIKNGTIEDFVLSGNKERLLIIANHPLGFSRAIYTYLDILGVKWYLPGERWEYVTSKQDISYNSTQYFSPSFSMRNFFGTGAIRNVPFLDPKATLIKEWNDWKRRNRMGGEMNLAGHYGETFNIKHRIELEQHPEYLAMIKGKRVTWNQSAKWCISNPGLRKLFVADRTEELKATLKKLKYPMEKVVLSVDPSDGGNDCECDNCKKLGSPSDNTFLLANETAKELARVSPSAYANIYAYNTHATPPSFALEPNLIVQIIPYAFQDVGTPQQMIEAWKKRKAGLLLYDYYSIPDWHFEIPSPYKTSPDTLIKRILYWKNQGLKGFMLESVYGTGTAGLGLYLMGRVGWDHQTNTASVKQEFYKNMFGGAAEKMKRYYEHIGNNYKGISDIPHLYSFLKEAKKNAAQGADKRILELQAYLHYILLYQQWYSSPKEKRPNAWEELVKYVWEIYPLKIIHSTRIADLFYYGLEAGSSLAKDWNIYEPFGPRLRQIKFLDANEITSLVEKDEKKYPLLEDFVYEKLKPINYLVKPQKNPKNSGEMLIANFPETYIRSSSAGTFRFEIRLNEKPAKDSIWIIQFKCIDTSTGATVFFSKQGISTAWKQISIKLPQGKTYKFSIESNPWMKIRIPDDQWIGFNTIPTYATLNTLWFYIPPATKYFYYSNSEKVQPVFINGSGSSIVPEKVNDVNLFRLNTKSSSGTWWQMKSSEYKFLKFYSKPDLFFSHPGYSVQIN